jgi:hydroxymethylbilane synthase
LSALAEARRQTSRRSLPLHVATRGSPLALIQTNMFIERLRQICPVLRDSLFIKEKVIHTTGDRTQDRSLADIGGKGLFAKEIHEALVEGRVDFGVHSLKDLETTLPRGITLGGVLPREDPRDALVICGPSGKIGCRDAYSLLAAGAVVGSNSTRRQAQLLHARPDLRIKLLRGNVQTRLGKLVKGEVSATLLAMAGLHRLGLLGTAGVLVVPLGPEIMVPSGGQGMIGITVRSSDVALQELLSAFEDADSRILATAERALLAELDGSCRTPIGSYARLLPDGRLELAGLVARRDGSFLLKRSISGQASAAVRLGVELGRELRADSPPDVFQ